MQDLFRNIYSRNLAVRINILLNDPYVQEKKNNNNSPNLLAKFQQNDD